MNNYLPRGEFRDTNTSAVYAVYQHSAPPALENHGNYNVGPHETLSASGADRDVTGGIAANAGAGPLL